MNLIYPINHWQAHAEPEPLLTNQGVQVSDMNNLSAISTCMSKLKQLLCFHTR